MTMQRRTVRCAALLQAAVLSATVLISAASVSAAETNGDSRIIARQRGYQQRAHRLMRELIDGVLWTQLQQLEENQMVALPIYADLTDMRERSSDLVDKEMVGAVALLTKAQAARGIIVEELRHALRIVIAAIEPGHAEILSRCRIDTAQRPPRAAAMIATSGDDYISETTPLACRARPCEHLASAGWRPGSRARPFPQ